MSGDVCINIGGESKVSISIYIDLSTCCRYMYKKSPGTDLGSINVVYWIRLHL